MKRSVQEAFDSIQLSEASKMRILEDIMDSQKPGYRTVLKQRKSQKWRAIPAVLVLLIVVGIGGFLGIRALKNQEMPNAAADPTESMSTVPTVSMDGLDYDQEYADVPEYLRQHVTLYAEALYENWPREKWEQFGLSLGLYEVKDRVACGFVTKDLNSDGFEDLLIYGGSQLYQMIILEYWPLNVSMDKPEYTLLNPTPEDGDTEITLCEDNVIMVAYFKNERDYYVSYNRVEEDEYGRPELKMVENVFAIGGTEWFAGANVEEAVAVSSDEAEKILSGYHPVDIEPRAFFTKEVYVMNYQHQFDGVAEPYLSLLMNYAQAICEDWPQSRWEEKGLSMEVYRVKEDYWSFEYALVDMDGNGEDELLIFGDNQLCALYVLREGQPNERLAWKIHDSAQRIGIELCENYVVKVCQKEANGAIDTSFFEVGKDGVGDLSLVMVNNALMTAEGQWYAGPNAKDAVPVSEEEALRLVDQYVMMNVDTIPMIDKVRIE